MGGLFSSRCRSKARLDGKTAIITGANTGIGKETAMDLARRGATVVLACRDEQKAEAAATELRKRLQGYQGAGEVRVQRLDLSSLTSVRDCARRLLEQHPNIHLLINNAGVMACPRSLTEDGFEMQLGVNHLGHFLFTCLLLPRLRASAPARIVVVSSLAHRSSGVTTYSLHPGVIATELGRHLDDSFFPGLSWIFGKLGRLYLKSPKQGAQTTIYCAVEESISNESGLYYSGCKKATPTRRARNAESARRLWEESLRLVKLNDWDPCTAPDGSQPL
ncbi:retinol dehydrogenase 13-like isoform X2 [Schistocerca serialis cubense]|uniref:retinol dehydrogenase 13-like isoform X2 n=1 Tax=Schistocerca serialis cubense TaxID=2023355 RepID=UPI00214E58DD|nr:retinol dehydrogenase 13-like isoform X2 [Schistocerca serialis cubense]